MLFPFQKFINCDWLKKHVKISDVFKMATALKTDYINKEYLKTSWGLKISYKQISLLILRPKLYR